MNHLPNRFEEQVFFTTVRIVTKNPGVPDASIGTGFLCRVPLGQDNLDVILLVSNKHVFQSPAGFLEFTCHKRGDGDNAKLGDVHSVAFDKFENNYLAHPDPSVDLACMNMSTLGDPNSGLFIRTLGNDMIASFNEDDLIPGSEAWFVGYPDGRFDAKNNLPLLRRGYISSMPKVDYNGKPQFVIDAPVHPGSSGSPVFAILGGHFKLLGVVSETMVKHGVLTIAPSASSAWGVQQLLGLGIVIKATMLQSLFEIAVAQIRQKRKQSGQS
jgi:hypothetical protein